MDPSEVAMKRKKETAVCDVMQAGQQTARRQPQTDSFGLPLLSLSSKSCPSYRSREGKDEEGRVWRWRWWKEKGGWK